MACLFRLGELALVAEDIAQVQVGDGEGKRPTNAGLFLAPSPNGVKDFQRPKASNTSTTRKRVGAEAG
ncbi:MAG: hypothetical protein ACC628_02005, partial [Pirellulaceae bacterium]